MNLHIADGTVESVETGLCTGKLGWRLNSKLFRNDKMGKKEKL